VVNSPTAIISGMRADISSIEQNLALYEDANFNSRNEAIDYIDFHILDRVEALQQQAESKECKTIKQYANKVKGRLEKIDIHLFKFIRKNIRAGISTGTSFREIISKYLPVDPDYFGSGGEIGYDNLDIFINGLLSPEAVPDATIARKPGMIFYQKTPARIIFQMAALAQLKKEDVFVDIGSGLGQVAMLVSLFSGATVKGIEYEPAYCAYATTCASALDLRGIAFVNIEARNGDYSTGTVFFMYTPFEGTMLQDILDILHRESLKRLIRIFTYGHCSVHVTTQSWLHCTNGPADNPYLLYEFSSYH
jgi:hypothetical protein